MLLRKALHRVDKSDEVFGTEGISDTRVVSQLNGRCCSLCLDGLPMPVPVQSGMGDFKLPCAARLQSPSSCLDRFASSLGIGVLSRCLGSVSGIAGKVILIPMPASLSHRI